MGSDSSTGVVRGTVGNYSTLVAYWEEIQPELVAGRATSIRYQSVCESRR